MFIVANKVTEYLKNTKPTTTKILRTPKQHGSIHYGHPYVRVQSGISYSTSMIRKG